MGLETLQVSSVQEDGQWKATIQDGYYPYPERAQLAEVVLENKLTAICDVWKRFQENYPWLRDPDVLSHVQPKYIKIFGDELIQRTAEALGIPQEQVRKLSEEATREQAEQLSEGGVVLKRHGKQVHPNDNKIEMMQDPANREDPAADVSLVEATGDAFALLYASVKNGKPISLMTSPDARARDVAKVFSVILGIPTQENLTLACMRIPPEEQLTPEGKELLLKNKGTISWNQHDVDAIIGQGTFDTRQTAIRQLVGNLSGDGKIHVLISHTQEHQEIAENPTLRLTEMGTVIVSPHASKPVPMQQGVFTS